MHTKLFSLCWLGDEVHWLIVARDGTILGHSPCGFETEGDALTDVKYRI